MRIANAVFWFLVLFFSVRSLPHERIWIVTNVVLCVLLCILMDRILARRVKR